MRTLDVFHQKCLRQLLGIRWYDRVGNDEVGLLQGTGLTSLSHLLSRRRISVFGHVARLDVDTPANMALQLHTHTHTRPFNGPLSRTTRLAGTRKVKPIWILLKQETVSGSDISWATCKSASRSRQITTPAPHHSVFTGRMPFLPPNQQCQSIEGIATTRP